MKSGSKTIVIVLLFVGLVLVNYLASQLPVRIDATSDQIYTLSPGTKALLGKITDPVTLEFYFSKDTPGLPVSYVNFAARVQEMLRQYVRASDGRLSLKVINPKTDTPEEEHATAAGLQPQRAPGSGESVYFGLVAIQADQQKVIPSFTPQRESFLEYDLSQLIDSVQRTDRKKLGLITSLPLQAPPFNPMMMQQQAPESGQIIAQEWARSFDLVPVKDSEDKLPDKLDALAIVHPESVSPKLQYAIDQFILSGKPVFIAVDPASQYFKAKGGAMAMYGGGSANVSSDLHTLLKGYGITYDPQNVVGDLDNATQVQTGAGGTVTRLPTWISLGPDYLSPKALPTAQLQSLLFVEPGSFTVNAPDVNVTPLVQTSAKSGTVMANTLQMMPPDDVAKQIIPGGKRIIAALLTGKFKSAFPDGPPMTDAEKKKADEEKKDKPFPPVTTPEPAAPAGLKESKTSSTLIVVADTDWLLDDYSVRKVNFFGSQGAEPLNDNLAFASNSVEFLAGSPELISIRGKGNALRPFTVVTKMENEAQQKYRQQLDALETRIADTQSKLSAIQSKQTDGGRLIATPEVQKTIRDFQEQEASMREQRREIRLALREGIDSLGNRLLLINLLATPLLVGVFGLWFYRARRR